MLCSRFWVSTQDRRSEVARRLVPGAPAYSLISVSGSARACGSPAAPPHVRVALVSWFRRHAAERLPEGVEAWRAKAAVAMPRVVIADQQKRCGSCDCSGTVRLNWRIVQAPMRLVDYVVVHELVHLPHRGPRRDYWRALRRVMPDYERHREDLRQAGRCRAGVVAGGRQGTVVAGASLSSLSAGRSAPTLSGGFFRLTFQYWIARVDSPAGRSACSPHLLASKPP